VVAQPYSTNMLAASSLLRSQVGSLTGDRSNWYSMPDRASEGLDSALTAAKQSKATLVLVSKGLFFNPECVALLGLACKNRARFVLVLAESESPHPGADYFAKLRNGELVSEAVLSKTGVSAEECAIAMQQVATSVALPFEPSVSDAALNGQIAFIAGRLGISESRFTKTG